jgi:hypothetical protein
MALILVIRDREALSSGLLRWKLRVGSWGEAHDRDIHIFVKPPNHAVSKIPKPQQ